MDWLSQRIFRCIFNFLIFAALLASTHNLAFAENKRQVVNTTVSPAEGSYKGPALFVGPEFGIIQSATDIPELESDKSGSVYGLKFLFSWIEEKWLFDVGVGWNSASVSGSVASNEDVDSVETSYGVAEIGMRYRFDRFEVGPVAQMYFGTDTSFSPEDSTVDTATKNQTFAGLSAYFGGYTWQKFNDRIGFQILTDITIPDRQITTLSIQYQFGIPLVREKPTTKVVEMVEMVTEVKTETKVVEKKAYIIDAGIVNFPTGKSNLQGSDKPYLSDLGAFLLRNDSFWEQIVITGHADIRGGKEYNEKLALERANEVINAMNLESLPTDRFKVLSKGFNEPVSKRASRLQFARDRRVEIEVKGPARTKKLKKFILKIKQRHRIPETCNGEECK